MGRSASPIDLDDDIPFIENEWIGQRKKYTEVPAFVRWRKDKDMEIPLAFVKHANFPSSNLSVVEFLAVNLPRVSSEIISSKVERWFSKDPPSILDVQILFGRSILSPAFLTRLEEAVGQAWLDGAKSIVDWRFNDGTDRLPLWIVTFWREAERLNGIQSMWKQSEKWLLHQETRKRQDGNPVIPLNLIKDARKSLASLQWNGKMDYCNKMTWTSQLSRLLGTFWLSDDHINMMVEEMLLDLHTEKPKDLKYIQVASLSFAREFQSVQEKLALPLPDRRKTLLYKYEVRVKEDGLEKLYFPIHVRENHWIAGMVNFKKKSIAFGESQYDFSKSIIELTGSLADSLYALNKGSGAPVKFIAALQTWLKHSFGKRFKSFGNSLDHVIQDDTYSCGIITANTIAHAILDRPLCHSIYATEERLRWFIRFASLYPVKSESGPAIQSEDIDMPLEVHANLPNSVGQAHKALSIADLLNPIDSGPSEYPATNDYDSDNSFDSDDIPNVPKPPKLNQDTYAPKPDSNGLKRERLESSIGSDTESSDGYESSTKSISSDEEKRKTKYIKAGEGTSRSAMASRIRRQRFQEGTLRIEEWRFEDWKKKVLKDDPKATFDPKDRFRPRHSSCGKYVRMKEPCNIGRWNDHIKACREKKSKKPAGGMPTLFQMGWAKGTGKKKKEVSQDDDLKSESECELEVVPCPGITGSDDPRVLQY